MILNGIRSKVTEIVSNTNETVENRLLQICELLDSNINYYNWVGFYFRNGNNTPQEHVSRKNSRNTPSHLASTLAPSNCGIPRGRGRNTALEP